ncbi:MAG TPA: hypothetical protein DDY34_12765 [Bacteroidales bacterium]|nr:hypothetical protein [Bacteroidales bacterium]HBH84663.1 hypothetical protein [Bacteroidales bacterium]
MKRSDISRRDFLGKATIAGAAGMATPAILTQPLWVQDLLLRT